PADRGRCRRVRAAGAPARPIGHRSGRLGMPGAPPGQAQVPREYTWPSDNPLLGSVPGARTIPTPGHALSINHVEYYAIQCGFTVERVTHDYGIDLQMYTYDEAGEIQNGWIV